MRKIRLSISGLGNVGRRLLELMQAKRDLLRSRFDMELTLVGACDSSGGILNPDGCNIAELIALKSQKKRVETLSGSSKTLGPEALASAAEANIFVELTLTNLKDGQPGLNAIRAALARKSHVVTANKGPLVLAYAELSESARSNGVQLLHSATVTGGLPTLNIGKRDLGTTLITKFEGVLNGTTNYILSRMTEGQSYEEALKHAQNVGMAEADPTLDVDGWDAANKLVIIANAVLRRPTKLKDLTVEGIRGVTPQQLLDASGQNKVIKLIARAEQRGDDYVLSVRPTVLEATHQLARVTADMMGVMYHTDINGTIFAAIEEEDPYPTAAAVLRDIVEAAR